MKILHLLQSNKFSGAENVVCQIIGIFQNDYDMQMIYCSRDGQIRGALEERNINFAPIEKLSVNEIKRVIKEQKPDIIHAHDMRASFVAARACGKIPLISHVHNNNFDSRGFSIKSIAYIFAAAKAKRIFWVSKSAYEGYAFRKHFAKKSEVLYNIIDVDALYLKMNEDKQSYDYDVVYLGRLSYPKNPQRLMCVLKKVVSKLPNVKIAIVGTGELESETKSICKDLDLDANVSFLGFQSNPLKILHDSKVMVMTSRWEGTPMCALEAMALGVPIVSTPTDGLCDLIDDGKNGYLSDDDNVLADKIEKLINNTQIYKNFSVKMKEMSVELNNKDKYKSILMECYSKA